MIRFLLASLVATGTLAALCFWQWPTPRTVITFPEFEQQEGMTTFVGSTGVGSPADAGRASSQESTVFRAVLAYSTPTTKGIVFDFIDGVEKLPIGRWMLPASELKDSVVQQSTFDQSGMLLVVLGADDNVWNSPQRIIEVNPWTQRHRDLAVPACSPEYSSTQRLLLRPYARRIVELTGDAQTELVANVYDLDKVKPIRTVSFPGRLGNVDGLKASCAFADVALAPNARFLILAESWREDMMQSPLGVEVWDLNSGERHCKIVAPEIADDNHYIPTSQSELWEVDPVDLQTYPFVSRDYGHCNLRVMDDQSVAIGWAPRKKYARDNAWQMAFFFLPAEHFDLEKQNFDPHSHWAARDYDAEGPLVETVSLDGTVVWLSQFPRWQLKTAKLTDSKNSPLTQWHTFPDEVCSDVSDELDADHVPGTLGIVIRSSTTAKSYASIPHAWIEQTGLVDWDASEWDLANDRVYWYDFATDDLQLLRRSNREVSLSGYALPTDDQCVYVQTRTDSSTQLEIWSLPFKQPRWPINTAIAIITGSLAMLRPSIPNRGNRTSMEDHRDEQEDNQNREMT